MKSKRKIVVSGADVVSPSPVAPPPAPPSVVPSPTIEVTTQTPETIVHGLAPETLAPGEPAATNIFEVVNPEPEMLATMIDGWDYFRHDRFFLFQLFSSLVLLAASIQ